MAVESAADRAVFIDADEFGTEATYVPDVGFPVAINGIFNHGYAETSEGPGQGVQNREAEFTCLSADLPSGAADDDELVIGANTYTVRETQPDGEGMTRLVLEIQ